MDATRGTLVIPKSAAAASAGDNTTAVTRPARPAMLPKITPGVSGATNNARPVASVFRRSPLENVTSTPGVSLPLTSKTASVARSPETICRGNSNMRAPAAGGAGGVGIAARGVADCAPIVLPGGGACCAGVCCAAADPAAPREKITAPDPKNTVQHAHRKTTSQRASLPIAAIVVESIL